MESEHPPLLKAWAALPLATLFKDKIRFPIERESWVLKRHFQFYKDFLFEANSVDTALRMLFWARVMMILLSLALPVLVFSFVSRVWNEKTGFIAGLLVVLEPNLLGNAPLVNTDYGFTLFTVAYVFALYWFVLNPTLKRGFLACSLFGLAQLTKFTAVFLLPLTVLLLLVYELFFQPKITPYRVLRVCYRNKQVWKLVVSEQRWKEHFAFLSVLIMFSVLVINMGYLFDQSFKPLAETFGADFTISETYKTYLDKVNTFSTFKWMYENIPVPLPYYYLKGLAYVTFESQSPHDHYLMGETNMTGFWYYYLITLVFKLPLLLILALCLTLWRKKNLFDWWSLTTIAFFVLIFSFSSKQNGIRYILPVIPFFCIMTAKSIQKWLKTSPQNIVTTRKKYIRQENTVPLCSFVSKIYKTSMAKVTRIFMFVKVTMTSKNIPLAKKLCSILEKLSISPLMRQKKSLKETNGSVNYAEQQHT